MSKYSPLWQWIKENGAGIFRLTFKEIEDILHFPVDHSFLNFKKELLMYGYRVEKISMKDQTITFARNEEQ